LANYRIFDDRNYVLIEWRKDKKAEVKAKPTSQGRLEKLVKDPALNPNRRRVSPRARKRERSSRNYSLLEKPIVRGQEF
jgi:hypothetical protein